ncbi:NAD(P)-binding domain [Cordyceps militaris CM01]|uniref:NAD(P)-binding domain n=1 Tax=Cordyceps militaris (strain CM01) TaxID=983644 RepID=G3JBV1_CORMM|nr:NAD(P)-binding domain [Cordyceps militaris CM01]EGX94524.1 NAD(P)-binding domain [Cordyceps militaris CM01]
MTQQLEIDALVVGAGIAGILCTYRLSRAQMTIQCIDVAGDVGGTWYWNRYPGAMSDTESYLYRYSWDKEDLQTYPWNRHYLYQPEILDYLRHVVAKHDLRKYMQFNTEMTSATWDEHSNHWVISCQLETPSGEAKKVTYRARYLLTCLGLLSRPKYPDIPGLKSYGKELVHSAKWSEEINLDGKMVGIIGNGSTGIQVMAAIAPKVGKLVSFQRHPQYSVPSGQGVIPEGYREKINADYERIWHQVRASSIAFGVPEVTCKTMEASPEERQQRFQQAWDLGNGFRFMFSTFGDLTTDQAANEEACKFLRAKIQDIVKNPHKAKALTPRDLYARRPLCDTNYYNIFNQENVDIVDLRERPIESIVPEGIKLVDGQVFPLDVLILATGFDAVEGNYLRVSIRGREGKSIEKHWEGGPTAYAAVACAGFPNMFMVSGPQGAFANFPITIESEAEFIMECILHSERAAGSHVIEVSAEAECDWNLLCEALVQDSLFRSTASWEFGSNIEGRKSSTKFYFGGLGEYRKWTQKEVQDGFPSFRVV